jgi:hypothetical protein
VRRAAFVLALALGAAACAPEPTQVLLVVSAEGLEVPSQLDTLRIEAFGNGSPSHLVREFDLTLPENALPLSLTLVPSANTGPDLHVIVTGKSARVVVDEQTATTQFVPNQASVLDVRLGPPRAEDGGVPVGDAGVAGHDGGVPVADAGMPVADAGMPVADAGTPVTDAAVPTDGGQTPDASRPMIVTSGYPVTLVRGPDTEAPTVFDVCPSGSLLVGVDFSTDQGLVRGARGRCGVPRLAQDGTSIELTAGQTLPPRGGSQTEDAPRSCPSNQVVTGFDARHGLLVDQLTLRCAPLELGAHNVVTIGAPTTLAPAGSEGGGADPTTDCGPGKVAAGVQTRSTSWLEGFGLICTTVQAR